MKVAIVGGGPRGLITLERLISWQKSKPLNSNLEISIFDAAGPGGQVWSVEQPVELIMNTVAQQITLFYDQSIDMDGPLSRGPNLYEWVNSKESRIFFREMGHSEYLSIISKIGPNDYAPRIIYGYYLRWFYDELVQKLPPNITVRYYHQNALSINKKQLKYQILSEKYSVLANYIIMSLGHLDNKPTGIVKQFKLFSEKNNLKYIQPNLPGNSDLNDILPGENVIIRGLGLSFYDFMARLTIERGGTFSRDTKYDKLVYHPSGNEPNIIAGSRHGVPYHAKGLNQKEPGEETIPHFLTLARINQIRRKLPITSEEFWDLFKREVEYTYYSKLLKLKYPKINLNKFQLEFLDNPRLSLEKLNISTEDRINWSEIVSPTINYDGDFSEFILNYLKKDIADAKLGTKTGPLTSSLEVFRDLRGIIRTMVDEQWLVPNDFINFFLNVFIPINDFLSIGPPLIRLEQLLALIEAKIIIILPPEQTIYTENNVFNVTSKSIESPSYQARVLIEARVYAVNATTTKSPLLQQLLHDGYAKEYEIKGADNIIKNTGAIVVDKKSYELIGKNGKKQDRLYFWGVPTEGYEWLTSSSPKPYVNDIVLRTADQIVSNIWNYYN